jgi:hypothetical protein
MERFLCCLKERDRLENTDIKEKLILKWIYKEHYGSALPALSWQNGGTICGLLRRR